MKVQPFLAVCHARRGLGEYILQSENKPQERLSTSSDTCYNLHKSIPTFCDKFIQIFLTFEYYIRVPFLMPVSYFTP